MEPCCPAFESRDSSSSCFPTKSMSMSRHDSWWDGMKCIFQHRQCVRDWYCYEYRNMTGCLWGTLLREWTKSGVYHLHTQSTLVNKTLYWHMWLSLAFDVPRKYSVKSTRNVPSHFLTSGLFPGECKQTSVTTGNSQWPDPDPHRISTPWTLLAWLHLLHNQTSKGQANLLHVGPNCSGKRL